MLYIVQCLLLSQDLQEERDCEQIKTKKIDSELNIAKCEKQNLISRVKSDSGKKLSSQKCHI